MMPYTVLGVSFFILCKFQVQLIIFVHTDDGGVEALLFAVKRLIITAVCVCVCVSCRKMQRKVLHDGNSLIKVFTCLYCTSVMRLK